MHLEATRLLPGDDLKQAITAFVKARTITAGVIVSAVGSLKLANMRMAGAQPGKQDVRRFAGPLEIVSLVGTVGVQGEHLHMSVSTANGTVSGGHLKDGCIVETTTELVIAVDDNLAFAREIDPATGFKELTIVKSND